MQGVGAATGLRKWPGEVLGLEMGGLPGFNDNSLLPLAGLAAQGKPGQEARELSQSQGQGVNQGSGLVTSKPQRETLLLRTDAQPLHM